MMTNEKVFVYDPEDIKAILESQLESTVRLFRPARDDWEGFESHWESKIPVVKESLTVQKPLSDEGLLKLLKSIDQSTQRLPTGFKLFARAIEKAHGIYQ